MDTEDLTLAEHKRATKTVSKKKTTILIVFLFIILVATVLVAGIIGKHFLNILLFTILFSFPLLILYRKQIAQTLPENIANWIVDEVEAVDEDLQIQQNYGFLTQPLYVREYQLLVLSVLGMVMSGYILYKRHTEFIGIMSSLCFAITSGIIMMEIF
jgi:hypothetical protein